MTSLYVSNRGVIISADQHQPVRTASKRLIEVVDSQIDALPVAQDHPLPPGTRCLVMPSFAVDSQAIPSVDRDYGHREVHQLDAGEVLSRFVIYLVEHAAGADVRDLFRESQGGPL